MSSAQVNLLGCCKNTVEWVTYKARRCVPEILEAGKRPRAGHSRLCAWRGRPSGPQVPVFSMVMEVRSLTPLSSWGLCPQDGITSHAVTVGSGSQSGRGRGAGRRRCLRQQVRACTTSCQLVLKFGRLGSLVLTWPLRGKAPFPVVTSKPSAEESLKPHDYLICPASALPESSGRPPLSPLLQ